MHCQGVDRCGMERGQEAFGARARPEICRRLRMRCSPRVCDHRIVLAPRVLQYDVQSRWGDKPVATTRRQLR
jgi:hypothetical protein